MYGDNAIGKSTARKLFSCFNEDCFGISDTPRSGRRSGFSEDRSNILIHNDPRQCTRELANVRTFAFNEQVSKIGCMSTACLKPKPQKSAVAICASLLARHRLARDNVDHSYPLSLLMTRNGVFILT